MRRFALLPALLLVASACSGGGGETAPTDATVATTTSTTMDIRVCEDLADEAVRWVEDLVGALEGIAYEDLVDRTRWSEDLVRIDEAGGALQAESDAAGCDEGLIRGAVVAAIPDMDPKGAAARLLLELLAPQSPAGTG